MINLNHVVEIYTNPSYESRKYYYFPEEVKKSWFGLVIRREPDGIWKEDVDGWEFQCKLEVFNNTELSKIYFVDENNKIMVKPTCCLRLFNNQLIKKYFESLEEAEDFKNAIINGEIKGYIEI